MPILLTGSARSPDDGHFRPAVRWAISQSGESDRPVIVVLTIASDEVNLSGSVVRRRTARRGTRRRYQARHRRGPQTAWSVLSETLGDHRRLYAALLAVIIITACLIVLLRCDQALCLEALTVLGQAVAGHLLAA